MAEQQNLLPTEPDTLLKVIHELAQVANILAIDYGILEGLVARNPAHHQLVADLRAAADRLPPIVTRLRAL